MFEKISLNEVAAGYIAVNGNKALLDPETPSFIRNYYDYKMPSMQTLSTSKDRIEAPGVITSLLNILFGEEDVRFAC